VWDTQDLVIDLGVYDDDDRRLIDDDRAKHDRETGKEASTLCRELSKSLGGFTKAVSVSTQKIRADDDNWLLGRYDVPPDSTRRLDSFAGDGSGPLDEGQLTILARHTRCRVSVDHAEVRRLIDQGEPVDMDKVRDVLFWWTPVVDEWLKATDLPSSFKGFRKDALGSIASAVVGGVPTQTDDVTASFDDWGDIDIRTDPLRIRTLGPATGGSTKVDVKRVLDRAGGLLKVKHKLCTPGLEWKTYEPQIATMECWLEDYSVDDPPFDVLLVYRGGGVEYEKSQRSEDRDRAELLELALDFTGLGVEVVFGLGHGDASALPESCNLPIGVYEATTPTAAAEWVLREFVNSRMANSDFDAGQQSV